MKAAREPVDPEAGGPAPPGAARPRPRPVVAVAGASAPAGRALLRLLAERAEAVEVSSDALCSLLEAERALEGAMLAVHVPGAAAPGAALAQASAADLDLLAADNLARAARWAGVRRIVALAPAPEGGAAAALAADERSRLEVERTLGAHGTPLSVIRGAAAAPEAAAAAIAAALEAEGAAALDPLGGAPRREPRARALPGEVRHGVRSVQRLPLPRGWTARDLARAYAEWLPRFMRPLIEVRPGRGGVLRLDAAGTGRTLLELTLSEARSTDDRALLYVTGGLLAVVDPEGRRRGRLEFREVLGRSAAIAALHDFVPRLPWIVYRVTQAPLHLRVMESFGRHLARCDRERAPPPRRAAAGAPGAGEADHGRTR
jgi:hypothetical protein